MDHFPSLAAKRKATNSAQASVSKFDTEEKVLQHLLDTKPTILCCGKELWLDKANIQEDVDGFTERFIRKGLGDRSERFSYLHSTLKQKWEDKPEKFLSLMGFLLSLEDNSTNVNYKIEVGTKQYSKLPDDQIIKPSEIKKQEEEDNLKRELLEEIFNSREDVVYSSESDLSDWDTDEEQRNENLGEPEVDGDTKNRNETSTVVLSGHYACEEEEHLDKKSRIAEWRQAGQEALGTLKKSIRQVKTTPLVNQPVISSQVDLHLKFGKFWEWKKLHAHRSNANLNILNEEDIIREILWSFQKPCTLNSSVFTNRYCFHPKNIISTASQATLKAFISEYGKAISAIGSLQSFTRQVLGTSGNGRELNEFKFPKIIQAFAHGISKVLSAEVSSYVGSLQSRSSLQSLPPSDKICSTLLQLHRRMREPLLLVRSLENIFIQSFGDFSSALKPEVCVSWIPSIKLISVLEMALSVERKPEIWRVLLYLFSHCLRAFMDDFLSPLGSQHWPPTCIFKRNRSVNVSDSNFWTAAVTVHPYEDVLLQQQVDALSCLKTIVPKMLVFLKVVEMLRQLEENVSAINGELPDSKFIVDDFLQSIVPSVFLPGQFDEVRAVVPDGISKDSVDFKKYFDFMNLSDRRVLGSFHSVLQLQNCLKASLVTKNLICDYTQLQTYLKITSIPNAGCKEILPCTVERCLSPIFAKGANSLKKIFEDYKVFESLTIFQQIILGAREDFAQSVLQLTLRPTASSRFTYEDSSLKDPHYQKLLNDCYPEGRENFDINFRLDTKSDVKCEFIVNAKFPLNVLLTPESVKKYLYVSQQLLRIRKSVWALNSLQLKDCKPAQGVTKNRLYLLRFALLHFCSSLRAFFTLKVFSHDFSAPEDYGDLNEVLLAHDNYLQRIELRLLKIKFMDAIIIKKMVSMSEALEKKWDKGDDKGLVLSIVIKLEECLKQCWCAVNDFCKGTTNQEFNELYYHLGPTPSYL